MMQKSQYCIVRPTETLVFLDMMAATMSVPPDEPLWTKANPRPMPHIIEPMIMLMKVSPLRIGSGKRGMKIPMAMDTIVTPKMVLMTKVLPTIL